MKNRTWLILLFTIVFSLTYTSCSQNDATVLLGNWTVSSQLEGGNRNGAFGFTIGNTGYLGGGYNAQKYNNRMLTDFWSYTPNEDYGSWTKMDSFPKRLNINGKDSIVEARFHAVSFSIGNVGFVGTGFNEYSRHYMNDFYRFDPSAAPGNQWSAVDPLPGLGRYGAIAFSVKGKAYVGCGMGSDGVIKKDFYQFNPDAASGSQWTSISFGGDSRLFGSTFVIGDNAYIVAGQNSLFNFDFWVFDGNTERFRKLRDIKPISTLSYDDDYASIRRCSANGLSANGKGYLAGGSGTSESNSVWEYDPQTDLWYKKIGFEGATRSEAVSFSMANGRMFVTTGLSSTNSLDDTWEFFPNAIYDPNY